jgi:hypothetical protein
VDTDVRIPKVGKTAWHWVLEALMIIVSVGLAFGVAEYRESRANHELATRVLRSLQEEVEHNLATLEEWTAFNTAFRQALAKADTSNSAQTGLDIYVAVRPKLPAGATIDVPLIRRGAWDAALSTGALRLVDYDVVAGLSDIYQMQESYGAAVASLVAGMHAASVFDPANRVITIRQATQWWNEISFLQKLQIDLYKKYLPAIRAAATGH